jgi:hypothetical protein
MELFVGVNGNRWINAARIGKKPVMAKKHQLHYQGCDVNVDGNNWTTEKPVIDGVIKNDFVLLIFDYQQYPDNKVARNLEGYSIDGERLWIAENPVDTPNEAYAEFIVADNESTGNIIEVGDLAGFHCSIDINNGKLVNVVFTK